MYYVPIFRSCRQKTGVEWNCCWAKIPVQNNWYASLLITVHSHKHTRLTRLRAPTLSGLVAQMMQTILRPVFARQVNNTGINRKIAFRDSKILAIMRGVILAREDAQAGDGLLLPAAIQSWLKGSRDGELQGGELEGVRKPLW
ncbi:hypothetical protein AHF37_11889 [Paragonimus kellicotti]|nr:hypothetical protein AHF37_11889 [Paragonimus kellicotti]